MLARSAARTLRTTAAAAVPQQRALATSARRMAEGATGSGTSRPGGAAQGDAFTDREQASENLYVRQQEALKLKQMQAKLQEQMKHMEELHKDVSKLVDENEKKSK